MAYFAKINDENIVVEVLSIPNEQENRGQDFLANDLQLGGTWIQTSFNNRIRKQYAGIGFTYDPLNDIFIAPQPFASWSLDENFDWQAPVPKPNEGFWIWDELQGEWINGETL